MSRIVLCLIVFFVFPNSLFHLMGFAAYCRWSECKGCLTKPCWSMTGETSAKAACDSAQGVMDQEAIYINLLGQAARFVVSAGQLDVFDSAGNRILVYFAG